MIGRGKRAEPPADPPIVSVRQLAAELQQTHGWASGTAENVEWASDRVAMFAAEDGLTVTPYWLPTMTAEQAERLLNRIVSTPDPRELAEQREAETYMASPALTPRDLMSIRGMGRHLAEAAVRGEGPVLLGEAYGPTDPPAPGGLREQGIRRAQQMDRLRGGLLDTVVVPNDDVDGW